MLDLSDLVSAVDESQVGFFLLDREWRFSYVNRRAAENVGMVPTEFVGKVLWELFPDFATNAMGESFRRVMASRVGESFPWNGVMTRRQYEVTVAPNPGGIATLWVDVTDYRQAEEARRASELRYRTLFETSLDGALLTAPDGAILAANREACRLLGRTEAEIIREGRDGLVVRDENLALALAERDRTGRVRKDLAFRRKDGTTFVAEIASTVFPDSDGSLKTSMILRDVTERKRTEEALRFLVHCGVEPGEDFFQSLACYLGRSLEMDYVCIDRLQEDLLTATTVAVYFDGRFEDNVTYTLGETPCGAVVDKKVCCFPKDVRRLFPRDRVLQDMGAESYVGTLLWDSHGKPIGLIAVLGRKPLADPDLASSILQLVAVRAAGELERRQAEEALRESEHRYRELVEFSPEPIAVHAEGRWVYVNPATLKLLGATRPEELLGIPVMDRVAPEARARAAERIQILASDRTLAPPEDRRMVRLDGSIVHIDATGFSIRYGGKPAVLVVMRDMTDRKRAEEQLREWSATLEQRVAERTAEIEQQSLRLAELASEVTLAEHRERQRLAKVLHDQVQQLLVAAKLHAGLLKRRGRAAGIEESAHQIDDLLRQALEASRTLTTDLPPPVLQERGLGPALEWLARRLAESHRFAVEVAFVSEAEPVNVDTRIFLFDAVRELLLNAVKHAGVDRARVAVDRDAERRVRVIVSDEGVGFDPATPRPAGAVGGFGLFSIQQRLKYMGGSAVIDSAPGRGTRVTLLGPVAKGAPRPRPKQVADVSPEGEGADTRVRGPESGRIRVVLADDHRILRQGLVALLREEDDIEVVGEASDGAEAVELARSLQPDVVVMDVSMPVVNGVEATRRIREDLPGVRVIGLSLHETGDMAAAMKKAGAVAYTSKGGPSDALVAAIRSAAGRPAGNVPEAVPDRR